MQKLDEHYWNKLNEEYLERHKPIYDRKKSMLKIVGPGSGVTPGLGFRELKHLSISLQLVYSTLEPGY